ncbi:type II secretion system protein GspG [Acidobacteriota bacterium]
MRSCRALFFPVSLIAVVAVIIALGSPSALAGRASRAQTLEGFDYLPADMVIAYNSQLPELGPHFDEMMELLNGLSTKKTDINDEIEKGIQQFHEKYGVDLRKDLLPLFEREFTYAYGLSDLDQTIQVLSAMDKGNKNKAMKSKAVQDLLNRLVLIWGVSSEKDFNMLIGRILSAHEIDIASERVGKRTFYTIVLPSEEMDFRIEYTFDAGMLLIGFSRETVAECLENKRSGRGLVTTKAYRDVFDNLYDRPKQRLYVNLPRIAGIINESAIIKMAVTEKPQSEKVIRTIIPKEGYDLGIGMVSYETKGGHKTEAFGPVGLLGKLQGAYLSLIPAIALPNMLNAVQKGKQVRTLSDMRSIAICVESYTIDNGYPPASEELVEVSRIQSQIEPTFIRKLPVKDGWGNPFRYMTVGDSYYVVSTGKDGKLDGPIKNIRPGTLTTNANRDIVYKDGEFIQQPKASRK